MRPEIFAAGLTLAPSTFLTRATASVVLDTPKSSAQTVALLALQPAGLASLAIPPKMNVGNLIGSESVMLPLTSDAPTTHCRINPLGSF